MFLLTNFDFWFTCFPTAVPSAPAAFSISCPLSLLWPLTVSESLFFTTLAVLGAGQASCTMPPRLGLSDICCHDLTGDVGLGRESCRGGWVPSSHPIRVGDTHTPPLLVSPRVTRLGGVSQACLCNFTVFSSSPTLVFTNKSVSVPHPGMGDTGVHEDPPPERDSIYISITKPHF